MKKNQVSRYLSYLLVIVMLVSLGTVSVPVNAANPCTDLIISQYMEGGGFNKAVEIYNGTDNPIDLKDYSLEKDSNGNGEFNAVLPLNDVQLQPGDVYIISREDADQLEPSMIDQLDTSKKTVNWNGDDQVRLVKGESVIDWFGVPGDVNFAKDKTFIRLSSVTKGRTMAFASTDEVGSEWQTDNTKNSIVGFGSHVMDNSGTPSVEPSKVGSVTSDVPSGEVALGTDVELSTVTSDAAIYFTLDGTDPVEAPELLYTGEISITTDTAIKAIAMLDGWTPSDISVFNYTIKEDMATEVVSIERAREIMLDDSIADKSVTVQGIITSIDGKIFIQDGTGGINLYKGDLKGAVIGDMIKVSGSLYAHYGLEEVTDFTVDEIISSGNVLVPREVDAASFVEPEEGVTDALEGTLVTIRNVALTASSYGNYIAEDRYGTVIVQPKASGSKSWLEEGRYSEITGVVNYEYGAYEIMPVAQDGIIAKEDIPVISIAEARALFLDDEVSDKKVTIKGVVTSTDKKIFLQDDTAGISLYDGDLSGVLVGDEIVVTGTLSEYYGLMRVSAFSVLDILSYNNTVNLVTVTAAEMNEASMEALEGMRVVIKDVTLKLKKFGNYETVDATGTTIVDPQAEGSGSWIEDGFYRSILGVVMYEYGAYEIMPVTPEDIMKTEVPLEPGAQEAIIYNMTPGNMTTVMASEVINIGFAFDEGTFTVEADGVELYLDDVLVDVSVIEGQVTYVATGLDHGIHTLKAVVTDVIGLKKTAEWTFKVGEELSDYNFYFGVNHAHSSYSDGKGTPTEAFDTAKANGLDWLFLSDHSNWYDGVKYEPGTSELADSTSPYFDSDYNEQHEYNKANDQYEAVPGSEWWLTGKEVADFNADNDDFVAFRGFEMTFGDVGHINVIGSETYVEAKSQMSSLTDFYDWVENLSKKQSSPITAAFNHPGWPSDSFFNQAYVPSLDDEFQSMEVGNGAPPYSYARSEEQFIRALDNGWHLAPTNGQDNHSTNWGEPDNLTGVIAKDLTQEGILEAFANRRVYSTETRNLELVVKANGYWMGSVIDVEKDDSLDFEIVAKDMEEPITGLQIITNGGNLLMEKTFDSAVETAVWNPSITVPGGANWYMVKVIHEDGSWGTASPIYTPATEYDVKFTKLEVDPEITLPGSPTLLRATVANMGLREVDDVEISFYVGSITPDNLVGVESISGIAAGALEEVEVSWTPDASGQVTVYAVMTEIPGVTTVTEISKKLTVVPANDKTVMIDSAHGNYDTPGGIGEFMSLLRQYGYTVVINESAITQEALVGVDVLVSTQLRGSALSSEENAALSAWVNEGGAVFFAAKSNYSDDPTRFNPTLEAMGSKIRFNDDNVYEPETSAFYNGGMVWSVYSYNLPEAPSGLNDNMEAIRMFSSSSLVNAEGGALVNDPSSELEILLAGNASSYNYAVGKQSGSGYTYNTEGDANGEAIPMIAKENVGSGKVVAAGRHFYSDFEIGNDVSNTAMTMQLVDWLAGYERIMDIQDVRDQFDAGELKEGDVVTVKGTAIVDEETLFDVIYIQDETSGISLYGSYQDNPADVFEGYEVIATGTIEIFEGEMELAYSNYGTDILYVGFDEVIPPNEVGSQGAMSESLVGTLIKTKGKVTEVNDVNSYFKIDDGTGEAFIHVDGYIGYDMTELSLGYEVEVIGIGSHGASGPRIRVRYPEDINVTSTLIESPEEDEEDDRRSRNTKATVIIDLTEQDIADTVTPESGIKIGFSDVMGHWARPSLISLINKNKDIIGGYPDGTYRPDEAITRAEFVKMIVEAMALETGDETNMRDIKQHWAKDYIAIALKNHVAKGYGNDRFGPDDKITREQMAEMVANALALTPSVEKAYDDRKLISDWALASVDAVTEAGLMEGYHDNTFRPQSNTTRAEAATVIDRMLEDAK